MHEKPEVLSPVEARQANRKRLNFRVLVTSLAMAIIVGTVLYLVFYNTPGNQPAPGPAGAPATGTPTSPTPPPPAP